MKGRGETDIDEPRIVTPPNSGSLIINDAQPKDTGRFIYNI